MNRPTRPEATEAAVHDATMSFGQAMAALCRAFAEAVASDDHRGADLIAWHAFAVADAWDNPDSVRDRTR